MSPQLVAEFSTPNDNFKTRTAKATFSQPSPCVTCSGFGATGWFCSYVTVFIRRFKAKFYSAILLAINSLKCIKSLGCSDCNLGGSVSKL